MSDTIARQRSPKLLIFLTVFIDLLGFGIIIPILGRLGAEFPVREGNAGLSAALMMFAYSFLQMIFSPFWGRLSDRHGRRPILLLSLAGSTASYLIFACADSFTILLLSRVLAGVCGANITAAQAYIADITSEERRTEGMTLIGIAFGLGFSLGPVIGGMAMHFWHKIDPGAAPHFGLGLAAATICGINFIWAIFKLPESLPPEKRGKVHTRRFATLREVLTNLRHSTIGPLVILFFLVTFAFANLEVSFSIYVTQVLKMNEFKIYYFFMLYGIVGVFAQGFLVRRMIRFIPEYIFMIPGIALLSIGLFILPFSARLSFTILTMVCLSIGQSIATPCILSLISRSASSQRQGNVMGTSQSFSSMARIVGPLFGGIVYDRLGPAWPFHAAGLIMAFAVVWAIFTARRVVEFIETEKNIAPDLPGAGDKLE